MHRQSAPIRISIGLMLVTVAVLLAAQAVGLVPDKSRTILDGRRNLCEALSVQCALATQDDDIATIRTVLRAAVERNEDVVSAGVRRVNGELVVHAGNHQEQWTDPPDLRSTPTHAHVPIYKGKTRWGKLEICFRPIAHGGIWNVFHRPGVQLVIFVALAAFVGYLLFMKRTLSHLDPSSVIPRRVRSTLDTLAEGVILLDAQERIVLANEAFANTVGKPAAALAGKKASELNWTDVKSELPTQDYPWISAFSKGESRTGALLGLCADGKTAKTFVVNAAPIIGGDSRKRGALATFDDVTAIEEKNTRLQRLLKLLRESRSEIETQNRQLQVLATKDPLTGCVNRRSFFERLETDWSKARRYGHGLACIMVDLDHFKNINDTHGHSVGDQVLRKVAGILRSMTRTTDVLCRYGGEEFCLLLPEDGVEKAAEAAERFRRGIAAKQGTDFPVSASFGVSSIELGAQTPQELVDQADKALYAAKHLGRNRAVRWDQMPDGLAVDNPGNTSGESGPGIDRHAPIPLEAVTALTSVLAHRDMMTAEHCHEVGDLCAAVGRGLIVPSECLVLEAAGQLHDIGKLGVPDSVLLKPGPLTEEEWQIMRQHDGIGVQIISLAFSCEELTEIVRTHHAWYGGNPRGPGLPVGSDIPLGARILTIADAFSAMTSDRPYRKAATQEEAFAELRRCSGTQFDAELVERMIEVVTARDQSRNKANPKLALPHGGQGLRAAS